MALSELILRATNETNTSEDWGSIVDICDQVRGSDERARIAIKTLIDRLQSRNGNVVMYSMIVADAIVKNCGTAGQREISSRAFLDAITRRLEDGTIHETIRQRSLDFIQQWATAMKYDPSLGYMTDVYNSLKSRGFRFPSAPASAPPPASKPAAPASVSKPAAKTTKEEEDEELQLALALSLSEFESRSNSQPKSSAPSKEPTQSFATKPPASKKLFQVRALYDFAGDPSQGELTLTRGDIVDVVDTTFKDWWKGELRSTGASGIFPQNYTEKIREEPKVDLNLEREVLEGSKNVELFLKVLGEVDPRTENLSENEKLQERYRDMLLMRPKVIKLIEYYSHRKDELLELSEMFKRAQQSYQRLLDSALAQVRPTSYYDAPPQQGPPPPGPGGYDYGAPPPPQAGYGYAQQQQYPSY